MGIFNKILGGVFGKKKQSNTAPEPESTPVTSAEPHTPVASAPETVEPTATAVASPSPPSETVDVSAILNEKATANTENLDWKTSIVDLLKLLGIDASYSARKELAAEIGISGYEGTADQNLVLHKTVLRKLSENGGIVPQELLD